MKKWLSLFLTVVMLLSCLTVCPAMATSADSDLSSVTAGFPGFAMTSEMSLSVDEAVVTQLLSSSGLGDDLGAKIVAIINNIGAKTVMNGPDAQAQLLLKGGPVMTMLVKTGENGVSIGSDLFPNSVLTIPAEMLQQLTEQVSSGLEGLDFEAIAGAVLPHVQTFVGTIQSKIGEPTATDFTYEGVQFTSMVPINITVKELAAAALTMVKGILAEDAVAPLLSQVNIQPSQIDEALENITNSNDEDNPQTEMGLYSSESGDMLFRAVLTKDDQSMTLHAGMLNNKVIVRADALSVLKVDVTLDLTAMTLDAALEANNNGMNVGISFSGRLEDGGLVGSLAISLNGMAVATINLKLTMGGEVTETLNTEGKTEISLLALQNDPNGESVQALLNDIQNNGLTTLLTNAIQLMPEEISALLGSMGAVTAP